MSSRERSRRGVGARKGRIRRGIASRHARRGRPRNPGGTNLRALEELRRCSQTPGRLRTLRASEASRPTSRAASRVPPPRDPYPRRECVHRTPTQHLALRATRLGREAFNNKTGRPSAACRNATADFKRFLSGGMTVTNQKGKADISTWRKPDICTLHRHAKNPASIASAYPLRSAADDARSREIILCGMGASAPAAGVWEGPLLTPLDVAAGPSQTPAAGLGGRTTRRNAKSSLIFRASRELKGAA